MASHRNWSFPHDNEFTVIYKALMEFIVFAVLGITVIFKFLMQDLWQARMTLLSCLTKILNYFMRERDLVQNPMMTMF